MKTTHCLLAALLCTFVIPKGTNAQQPDNVQQTKTFEPSLTKNLKANYLLFLPKGYDAKAAKKWPLLLFLHGAGERGTNVWLVAKHGPPKLVKDRPDFPFIVVSPQVLTGQRWENDTLLALLDDIIATHKVDTTRVYLTGLSMGGYGTWSLGTAHPERFAAIAPICGGGDTVLFRLSDPKKAAALKELPIWAFHGDKDTAVPLKKSEEMIEALKKFGCEDIKLTIYPGVGHDSWTETYNNQAFYDWLLKHQRK
ncbi:MAG: phospholipase [Pedosphaera sp.]|nr:phospholipase [Pedosphaera sp.]MST00459.1 phospholipase [Pedosphaera sp.]